MGIYLCILSDDIVLLKYLHHKYKTSDPVVPTVATVTAAGNAVASNAVSNVGSVAAVLV